MHTNKQGSTDGSLNSSTEPATSNSFTMGAQQFGALLPNQSFNSGEHNTSMDAY